MKYFLHGLFASFISALIVGLAANVARADLTVVNPAQLSSSLPKKATVRTLKSVCKTTRNIKKGEIWKSIASRHFSGADPRSRSTSFITAKQTTPPNIGTCINVYDKKGNLVHKLGRYEFRGPLYSSRYYGGSGCGDRHSASTIARAAIRKTKSSTVYLRTTRTTCIKIPNAARCYNSTGC